MREIKFRLRDRHNKIVGHEKWYIGCWHPDDPSKGFSPISGYWEAAPCWLYSTDGEKWTPIFIPHRYKDQYTGLKDKNGVEIYEGDIVTHPLCVREPPINVSQGTSASWRIQFEVDRGQYFAVNTKRSGYVIVLSEAYKLEVIDNIYENPEMVKDE